MSPQEAFNHIKQQIQIDIASIEDTNKHADANNGEWVYGEFDIPHCSECGREAMPKEISPYCPHCGAHMEDEVIRKGTNLVVNSKRKGTYKAIATRDFDIETEEFYPVATRQTVRGMANEWLPGESIPCRKGISAIRIDEEEGE